MAIDHGLGGKDNKKSQQKREKKAKRIKALAVKALHSGTKKKEVVFDENARVEWLTGFHKRKQERRKFGLAMQIVKDKKAHKEAIKDQRATLKAASLLEGGAVSKPSRGEKKREAAAAEENSDDEYDYDYGNDDDKNVDDNEDDTHTNSEPGSTVMIEGETVFEDETTTSLFGGTVSVVVDTGVADDLFVQNNPDMDERFKPINPQKFREKKELTRLEKAMKEVNQKGLMNRRSKFKSSSSSGSVEDGSRGKGKGKGKSKAHTGKLLFHKALGSGTLGANTFKAKNKGKRS